jgi:hypothetical protein
MSAKKISRRDFVVTGTAAAAAVGVVGASGASSGDASSKTARVVLIRDSEVVKASGELDGERIHRVLNDGMTALFETDDHHAAWRRLVAASDVVGIKSNEWGHLPTPPSLEQAIRSEVIAAGVSKENVAIGDRRIRKDSVFQRATAMINTRPMRTHHWSGLGTCLKNMITITERWPDYHADACAPLGSIWQRPDVKGKVRLNVLVMLTPQFHSVGPHSFAREYVWSYGGLILGVDPVAVDATGARIIEAKRQLHFGDGRPILPPPHHIEIAETRYGVGVADPAKIDLVRLGWQDDALI